MLREAVSSLISIPISYRASDVDILDVVVFANIELLTNKSIFKKRHLLRRSPNQSLPWTPRGLASNPPVWVDRFLGFCGSRVPLGPLGACASVGVRWFGKNKLQRRCADDINMVDVNMNEDFLTSVANNMLAKMPSNYVGTLRQHHANHVMTLGTACSGTDSPVFVLRAIAKTIGAHVKHNFSCEREKAKQSWIKTACDIDNDFQLFDDITEIGCERATNVITGDMELVPTSTIFVAGFSCKSVSRSVAFVVVEYFFGTCSPHCNSSYGTILFSSEGWGDGVQ